MECLHLDNEWDANNGVMRCKECKEVTAAIQLPEDFNNG